MSPWAKIDKPESINFVDVLSEERDLQTKEKKAFDAAKDQIQAAREAIVEDIPDEVLKTSTNNTFESDGLIAQMLQILFDKEYDEELKRTEQRYNGFENGSEDEVSDIWDRGYCDSIEKEKASIPACSCRMKNDGKLTTKHDFTLNGRRNAHKLLSLPPDFQTGDGELFDLKLSNKVFNSLRIYSHNQQVRRHKVYDRKELAIAVSGIDQTTRAILYKMVMKQLFEGVNGVVSVGKEAVILHADLDPSYPNATESWPTECAIKVFNPPLCKFKQHYKYIRNDDQFKDTLKHQTTRKMVQLRAEKEMANLMRLKRAGIPCPQVIALKDHVLVMSFIGQNNCAAPKLINVDFDDARFFVAYTEVRSTMNSLYDKANLIHANLSEYNILWHNNQCYFIGISQSVDRTHNNAFRFLYRDCTNIITFFRKRISEDFYRFIQTPDELFKLITGCDFKDKVALRSLQESFKMKHHPVDTLDTEFSYNFATAWEKVKAAEIPLNLTKRRFQNSA